MSPSSNKNYFYNCHMQFHFLRLADKALDYVFFLFEDATLFLALFRLEDC